MFASTLALVAAAAAAQASDTTRASREAFTACLRTYVDRSIDQSMTQETFDREYPQQCAAQQSAFRDAIIRRETASRISRADAEEQANIEIEDARINFSERFVPPREGPQPQQAAAQAQQPQPDAQGQTAQAQQPATEGQQAAAPAPQQPQQPQ